MRFARVLLVAALLGTHGWCAAQDSTPANAAEPEAQQATVPAAPQITHGSKGFYRDGWKDLGPRLLVDQGKIWRFPISVAKGRHLKPTLAIAGITAGLIGVDKYTASYFNKTNSYSGFNRAFSGPNTALGTEVIPAALYTIGLITRDKYAQETFFLAGRAVLDGEILTIVMKDIDRRSVPADGNFSNTWFTKRGGSYLRGAGSFPSGHTIAAFAVATVYARRYPGPRWHKWVAYGLAGAVGFSRLSLNAHYTSDVFLGAALGYVITRYVVLRPH